MEPINPNIKEVDTKISQPSLMYAAIVVCYLLVEFVSVIDVPIIDNMGVHWLYLACLNLLVSTFLVIKGELAISKLSHSIFYALLIFNVCALVSIIPAFNKVEWLVTFSRLIITLLAFCNLSVVFMKDAKLQLLTTVMLMISGACQAGKVIFDFASGSEVQQITAGLGNKNILAASIMIKFGCSLFIIRPEWKVAYKWLVRIGLGLISSAVYLLSARSSIVGMGAVMVLYTIMSLSKKPGRTSKTWIPNVAIFIGITVLMQLVSMSSDRVYKHQSIGARVISIKNDVAPTGKNLSRITLLGFGADFIKSHPFTGGGLGNWKINAIPYEQPYFNEEVHSKHLHNDFIEIAADIGITGLLAYLSIFVICGIFLFRIMNSGSAKENNILYAAPFAGMVGYFVDALFNFPLERAGMQMLFAVLLALNVANYLYYFPLKTRVMLRVQYPVVFTILLLSCGTIFISWNVFRSMEGQYIVMNEINEQAKTKHAYEDINSYCTWIPNITETMMPIAQVKAKYLYDEGRYDEAMDLLNADKNSNPYAPSGDFYMATIYKKKGNADSAIVYYRKAYDSRRGSFDFYAGLQKMYAVKKDTILLRQVFREYSGSHKEAKEWVAIALWHMEAGGKLKGALQYLNEGLQQHPGDTELLFHTHYLAAYDLNQKELYPAAIAEGEQALSYRTTYPALFNLGLACFGNRDYPKAADCFDKAIKQYGSMQGEANYFRGQCAMILNDKKGACADFKIAAALKYPVSATLLDLCR
jgi:O-antigen ligase/tetratricopeptide (TPR) repeat protein